MTRNEWLTSGDPGMMARFCGIAGRERRLFCLACANRVVRFCPDFAKVLMLAERLLDRSEADRRKAWRQCEVRLAREHPMSYGYGHEAALAVIGCLSPDGAAWFNASRAVGEEAGGGQRGFDAAAATERASQADLLRCIAGDPWLPVMADWGGGGALGICDPLAVHQLDAGLLAWGGGAVPKMAVAIYDDRRFEDTPIIADLCEDAGCHCEPLLNHLRNLRRCPGCSEIGHEKSGWCEVCGRHTDDACLVPAPAVHARGCWAIDLLRGGNAGLAVGGRLTVKSDD